MSIDPPVLMIDDGELDDVQKLLEELEIGSARLLRPADLAEAIQPARVVIATPRYALSLDLHAGSGDVETTGIAVVEGESRTLTRMLLGAGYRYVVNRPVHPQALRLLLLRALFRGNESRRQPRFPIGSEVGVRQGWRRRRATLLDISPEACRLTGPMAAPPGARLAIRIPREVTGGRALTLQGRVLRCRAGEDGVATPGEWSLVVAFENLGVRGGSRLAGLLAQRAVGPATLPREPQPAGADAGVVAEPDRAEEGAPSAQEPADADRRRHPRGEFRREVAALAEEASRVIHVFVGRDLSVGGLRVEPHPSIAVGDRLGLAIYDSSSGHPLLVDAVVIRNDGPRGFALRFVDVSEDDERDLARMIEMLPAIEGGFPTASEPRGLMIAQLV